MAIRNLNLSLVVLVLLAAVATLLPGSAAQTKYVVGDSTGWTIPSGGDSTYRSWAANKTFAVGDSLLFNFSTGQHSVAKVTKSAFDGCNGGNPAFTITTGPATVTLNETGEQYYICTFSGHCSGGMKLAINVTQASSSSPSPAPQPSSPVTPPAPAPSGGPVTYTVGDSLGWTVPPTGPAAYQTWAAGKKFKVGDILLFNFTLNRHNVEEVTKAKFDSCSSTSPIATYTNPPVRVTLNRSGEQYFICGYTGHCAGGQKLAINVTGSSTATPPSSSGATPPSPTSNPTPSSPSPSGAGSPSPPNSEASSLGAFGLSATFLSIAAAFFY